MQDKFSSLNLVLKYVRLSYINIQSAKLDRTKPDHSKSDQAGPNDGLHHHIVMYRQTRDQSKNKVNRQDFLFLVSSNFLKNKTFQKMPLILSSCKEAPNPAEPRLS
jgi:hypothetical protein